MKYTNYLRKKYLLQWVLLSDKVTVSPYNRIIIQFEILISG